MVEETQFDEVVTCDHSYDKRCHTSYVTSFLSQQEEECEENFRKVCVLISINFINFSMKVCYIEYEPQAFNETVEVCRTPVIKDCNNDGGNREQICRTVYETECWTKHNVHEVEDDVVSCETVQEDVCQDVVEGYLTSSRCKQFPKEKCSLEKKKVKKVTPDTGCNKEPVEVCAPRGCGFVNVSSG